VSHIIPPDNFGKKPVEGIEHQAIGVHGIFINNFHFPFLDLIGEPFSLKFLKTHRRHFEPQVSSSVQ